MGPSDYEHKFAQVADETTIHYIDVGPRDATPLVLLHGWPDLWFGWRKQIGPLSQKYRVVVPVMRGFGQSSAPKENVHYGSKTVTGDLTRLLDILEINQAVCIGHDWGAAMAWRMCLYHADRVLAVSGISMPYIPPPNRFADLVTTQPQLTYVTLLGQPEKASALRDGEPRRLFTDMFRHYIEGDDEEGTVLDLLENVGVEHPMYTELSPLFTEGEIQVYVDAFTKTGFQPGANYYARGEHDYADERQLSTLIERKALCIGARDDPVLKPEMADEMPKFMPNIEMTVIEDAGHWVLWEQPEKVNQTLLAWLEKVVYVDSTVKRSVCTQGPVHGRRHSVITKTLL